MKWVKAFGLTLIAMVLVPVAFLTALGALVYGSQFGAAQMGMTADNVMLDTAVASIVFFTYLVMIPATKWMDFTKEKPLPNSLLFRVYLKAVVGLLFTGLSVPVLMVSISQPVGNEQLYLPMAAGIMAPIFGWLVAEILESAVDLGVQLHQRGWQWHKAEGAV